MYRYFFLTSLVILTSSTSQLFLGDALAQKMVNSEKLLKVNEEPKQQIQITQCLASQLSNRFTILSENEQFKLIEVSSSDLRAVSLLADKFNCGRFINRSSVFKHAKNRVEKENLAQHFLAQVNRAKVLEKKTTYEIKHPEEVNRALLEINSASIVHTLTHLVSYYNRSAYTKRGLEVAQWLKKEVDNLAKANHRTDVSTYFVATGQFYKQPSLVTVIGKDLKEPAIVLGAHMDTLDGEIIGPGDSDVGNGSSRFDEKMPGAGDDGSGSSSLMEITRVLMASNMEFKRPIYLIWYAAEELGLIGSQQVVRDFQKKSIPVKAVVQFDMTGFRNDASDPTMWIFQDYTDQSLSNYLEKLIETYIKVPVAYSHCGYGCSDHASWMEKGIPAAFPCETSFEEHNPYIHTKKDTMDRLNVEHMTNFAKLGLSFAIEQGID